MQHIVVVRRVTAKIVIDYPGRRKVGTAVVVETVCLGSHTGSLAYTILLLMLPPCWYVMVMVKVLWQNVNIVREEEVP